MPSGEDVEDVFEDIRQTSLRRSGIDPPRKAVYVFSACGGGGGTSLATTIARKFSREGRRTLYIDLDLATGPGSFMFNAERGARETMGLMEALANPGRIDALFLERAIDVADKNLFYLSARRRSSDPNPDPASIPILVSRAQQNFDMVVVDVPWRPNPEPDMMAVQGHCYVVAPPTPAGLLGFSVLIKEIDSAPARNPVYGIINRHGEFKSNDIERSSFKEAGDVETIRFPMMPLRPGGCSLSRKPISTCPEKSVRRSSAFSRLCRASRCRRARPGGSGKSAKPARAKKSAKPQTKKKGLLGR